MLFSQIDYIDTLDIVGIDNKMSSFLCFVCHSTVNADTNEDTRDKYREVIGMNVSCSFH